VRDETQLRGVKRSTRYSPWLVRVRVLIATLAAAAFAAFPASTQFAPKPLPSLPAAGPVNSPPFPRSVAQSGSAIVAAPYVTGDLVGDANPAHALLAALQQAAPSTLACRAEAYVTGELVGEANPSAVQAALCRDR
jgi:hypothetical protein